MPLVLRAPGLLPASVVRTPVRHVDVVPTVLDLLGLQAPADLPGRSLLPVIAGSEDAAPESYLESLSPWLNRGWAPLRGVVDGGLKYVDLPLPEVYDLAADPGERKNLAASRPQELDRLRGRLARLRVGEVAAGARVQEDESALERLRALGYVSGGVASGKQGDTAEDDPKNLIALDARIEEVITLYRSGQVDAAIAACEEILRRRPDMPQVYLQLAYLERSRGRLDAAIAASRRALVLRPLDSETVSLHAVYLTEAGRPREALRLLEPLAKAARPDIDVLNALGMAQARAGERDAALATFARAREPHPTDAMVLVNAGTVYLMAGDRARAREAFEAALELDDRVARAHNGLGVIAAAEGRTAEAIARWQRAAALDPRDYQTLFNLGTTLRDAGRGEEARAVPAGLLARRPGRPRGPGHRARSRVARGPGRPLTAPRYRSRFDGTAPAGGAAASRRARASVSRPCG